MDLGTSKTWLAALLDAVWRRCFCAAGRGAAPASEMCRLLLWNREAHQEHETGGHSWCPEPDRPDGLPHVHVKGDEEDLDVL